MTMIRDPDNPGTWPDNGPNSGEWIAHAQDTELPEQVKPEPGDICEGWHDREEPEIFKYDPEGHEFAYIRVLARKLPGWEEARAASLIFMTEISACGRWVDEEAAYNKFLSAILGGATHARVE